MKSAVSVLHGVAQVLVERGEDGRVRRHVADLVQLEPAVDEVAGERGGPRVGEHAAHLHVEDGGPRELAALGEGEQLVVGDAVPQEEREPRRQLDVVDAVDRRVRVGGRARDAEEELRVDEHPLEHGPNARVEVLPAPAPSRRSRTGDPRRTRSPAGDRRAGPGSPMISRAQASSAAPSAGRQTKSLCRLATSSGVAPSNGPPMTTFPTAGSPPISSSVL